MDEKKCPFCGLINPQTAVVCDCGYNFETNMRNRPDIRPKRPPYVKIFLTALAYIGLALMVWGTYLVYQPIIYVFRIHDPLTVGWAGVAVGIGSLPIILGALLALVAAPIARTRFLWLSLIIIGSLSEIPLLVSFLSPYTAALFGKDLDRLMYVLPGLACITEGIVLHTIELTVVRKLKKHNVRS